jgi:succinate-semialdehyde dehydrogenase / glutarate-semialdehyde dehydrogenase
MAKIESINPATDEVLATFDEMTPVQVDAALARGQAAYEKWRHVSFAQRSAAMHQAAAYLRQNKAKYATLATAEMGKPILQAEAELEKCAWNCDFYADNAEKMLASEEVKSSGRRSFIAYDPIGIVLAVMPWNYPFWQVFRFIAPGLMAGNVGVLKHASNVPQCALAIEEIIRKSGFPPDVFQTLLISSGQVARVIEDERIRAVTLTGSDITGSKVAEVAGRALKKCVLELGGSDPYIVLADADLKAAANVGAVARCQNNGQSCIAAKRFIVEEKVAAEFEKLLVESIGRLKVGDPSQRDTDVGPIARADLRDELHDQVVRGMKDGGKLLLGGKVPSGKGAFYPPTIVTGVDAGNPLFREETFGPVAAIIRAKDVSEAIKLANTSQFGLGAALWTRDEARGWELAREIDSGMIFINGMVASDPRLPFGGVKRSGYGRELAVFGIREFCNIKTVWTGPAVAGGPPQASTATAE